MRERLVLLVVITFISGCSGSQGPRPSGPEEKVPAAVFLARADSSAARGARTEARADYVRAAEAAKRAGDRNVEFRAELEAGRLSLDLAEPETARRSLTRAVQLVPESAEAHDALGLLHTATRRYMDAKSEFDKAAALDTLTAIPLYHLGMAYAQAGDSTRAAETFRRALARDPNHAPTLAALGSTLGSRYRAAGLPDDYPVLRGHESVSRGELGVMLAAELGADPERPAWRSGTIRDSDTEEARGAWGEPWLRVSIERGWITPFPDRSFHLGDPVTRGTLALLVARIAGSDARPATDFPDLGRRHYLARAASEAVALGMPTRGSRFEPSASVTGAEALAVLQGLARRLGLQPVVGEEQRPGGVVK